MIGRFVGVVSGRFLSNNRLTEKRKVMGVRVMLVSSGVGGG